MPLKKKSLKMPKSQIFKSNPPTLNDFFWVKLFFPLAFLCKDPVESAVIWRLDDFSTWGPNLVDIAMIITNQSELEQYVCNEILCTQTIYIEIFCILMHRGWGSLETEFSQNYKWHQLFYLFPSIINIFFQTPSTHQLRSLWSKRQS